MENDSIFSKGGCIVTTVLVVEDDRHIRLFITANLRARGFEVVEAEDPASAGHLVSETSPQVVLLDILFTEGSGWDFARWLATHPRFQEVPVIVMTASEFDFGKRPYEYHNVARRLMKPISAADLIATIQEVLTHPIS
jgi:DNA-binding response OmpR family regulator